MATQCLETETPEDQRAVGVAHRQRTRLRHMYDQLLDLESQRLELLRDIYSHHASGELGTGPLPPFPNR